MNEYTYKTGKVCSRKITFQIDGEKVKGVKFLCGCEGNLQGLSRLVEGMNILDVIERLKGIDCEGKGTSCPDQLAKALEAYIAENKKK